MNRYQLWAVISVTATATMTATPSYAQMDFTATVIGATMAANSGGRGCAADMKPNPVFTETVAPTLDDFVNRYLAASATDNPKALKALFTRPATGGVRGAGGSVPPSLKAPIDGAVATAARRELVVAGDYFSGRGIWEVSSKAADGTDAKATYAVDFIRDVLWGRWRIWRVRIYGADEAPPVLEPFCQVTAAKPQLW